MVCGVEWPRQDPKTYVLWKWQRDSSPNKIFLFIRISFLVYFFATTVICALNVNCTVEADLKDSDPLNLLESKNERLNSWDDEDINEYPRYNQPSYEHTAPLRTTSIGLFLGGAIAGGNCVILKPSELSPATTALISSHLPKYLDKRCFQVFVGGVAETSDLLTNKFDYIFFTGSTTVGKIIHQAAAQHLTPTTLELGGKSPVFIDASADIAKAARRVLWGKCLNAGQTCLSPDYLLCTEEVQEEFLKQARKVLTEFYGENKLTPYLSKILNERHYNRLTKFFQDGTIALGGQCDPRERVISPTVLTNVDPEASVMKEEIFGPLLPVITVKSPEAAVDFINSRDKPLALYVFTKNKQTKNLFLEKTSSGAVTVNDTIMHVLTENLPFGGVGGSGMGSYHGRAGFETFTHQKAVLVRGMGTLSEMLVLARYPPYSEFKAGLISCATRKRRGVSLKWIKYVLVFALGVGAAFGVDFFCRRHQND